MRTIRMLRAHYGTRVGDYITQNTCRAITLHATAGTNSLHWLQNGGGNTPSQWVSCHYLIDKSGNITQFTDCEGRVADPNRLVMWHTGPSTWNIDGVVIPMERGLNGCSIGIELENLNNGIDPYPPNQYAAALRLTRDLVARYNIPRNQLVRHLDIAPGRKNDPAGFPWEAFRTEVYDQARPPLPADPRVIGTPPTMSLARWNDVMRRRSPITDERETAFLWHYLVHLDIDPCAFLAMWIVEQGPTLKGTLSLQTRNPLNVVSYGERWPRVWHRDRYWNQYETWQLGVIANGLHLKQIYGARGLLTVRQIVPVFAPSGDGNDVERYIASVIARMKELQG